MYLYKAISLSKNYKSKNGKRRKKRESYRRKRT